MLRLHWLLPCPLCCACQVTIASIQSTVASREKERERERADEEKRRQRLLQSHEELPTENANQLERQRRLDDERQYGRGGVVEARSLDEAIGSLSVSSSGEAAGDDDRHRRRG